MKPEVTRTTAFFVVADDILAYVVISVELVLVLTSHDVNEKRYHDENCNTGSDVT